MVWGIVIVFALIIGVSLLSARRVKDAEGFTTAGGRAGTLVVIGIIMTSLVGGQSTIGTAQLAFAYGISAWWFTIGAALGCLLLAFGYGKELRATGRSTLLEVVKQEYGPRAETTGSILCSVGIFISIVAQILSSSAIMTGLFHVPYLWAAVISVALMMLMVVMGGVWGAGYSGLLKAMLLCVSAIATGIVVLVLSHGYDGLMNDIGTMTVGTPIGNGIDVHTADDVHRRFGNLVARGVMKDLGGCLSLVLGVVATQTYAQGILAASRNGVALRGGLICTVITPFIGAGCVLVGLYMRAHYITADEARMLAAAGQAVPPGVGVLASTAEAFPAFVIHHLPGFAGGVVMGTMLLTIIGGGSGLALGAATIMVRDVYGNVMRGLGRAAWQSTLGQLRWTIVGILLLGIACSMAGGRTFINDLGFLSLGLRATAVLVPLTAALFLPRRVKPAYALAGMVAGTAMMLVAQLASLPGGPIWWGLAAGVAVTLPGVRRS